MPPSPDKAFATLLPAVDDDGNELAGIRPPEVVVPIATRTGWTLRHKDIGGETQLLMFAAATILFATTESQRIASGDPRASIAERYASKDDYLGRIRDGAEKLVKQRYMLEDEIEFSLEQAERSWDYTVQSRSSEGTWRCSSR